jgi:hypothetical protein
MTKHFAQGRDLTKPLIEIPASAPWYKRVGLRLYSSYLWLIFGLGAVALIIWTLTSVLDPFR